MERAARGVGSGSIFIKTCAGGPEAETMLMQTEQAPRHRERQVLLNLKCLFWCLHELRRQYSLNLALHTLERGVMHPDVANSHLGDNLQFLLASYGEEEREKIRQALLAMIGSRTSVDVDDKHFEVGHYIQAADDFGAIAEGSRGIIASVTPRLLGLFYLDDASLMLSEFAPSNVGVIFGTYIHG
jgi:hypothetical protein